MTAILLIIAVTCGQTECSITSEQVLVTGNAGMTAQEVCEFNAKNLNDHPETATPWVVARCVQGGTK